MQRLEVLAAVVRAGGLVEHQPRGPQLGLLTGRAMDWDPKEQWHAGAMLKKRIGQSQLSIRSEWFDEKIQNAGNVFGSFDQRAMDEYYQSNRLLNHIDFGTYLINSAVWMSKQVLVGTKD